MTIEDEMRPTPAQAREMARAAAHPLGIVEARWPRGLAHAGWERMMARLTAGGLMRPYVHGGFEITAAGRAALPHPHGDQ